jgi:transcriptional regulator with XRE-family HTH domain
MRHPGRAIRTRVGRAIRRFRLLRKMSQERLAELAGSSWKYLGQVERGHVNVSLDVLGRLAAALSIDVADLVARSRGRGRSKSAVHVITGDDADRLLEIARRVKGLRAPRSKRPSR